MAENAVQTHGVSIALACRTFQISETCYRYERKLSDEDAEIADWLVRLTANRLSWGFGLCFLYLRHVKGFKWNHKRVYRIYCERELNLRIKPKKRLKRPKCMYRLLSASDFVACSRKSLICIRPVDRHAGRGLVGVTHAP